MFDDPRVGNTERTKITNVDQKLKGELNSADALTTYVGARKLCLLSKGTSIDEVRGRHVLSPKVGNNV